MIRILVVDDHPVVREGLVSILSAEPDFEVVGQAPSGEQAVTQAQRLQPDVAVIDLRLPGMSGIEVCRELRQRGIEAPVLMLTARGLVEQKVEGLDA